MAQENESALNRVFDLGIEVASAVASLSFVGYLMGYSFKYGYYKYFDVPSILIRVGIEDIIPVVISIGGIAFLCFIVIALFLGGNDKESKPNEEQSQLHYYPALILVSFVAAFLLFVVNALQQDSLIKYFLFFVIILMPIGVALLPKFFFPGTKSFRQAISLYNKKIDVANEKINNSSEKKVQKKSSILPFNLFPKSNPLLRYSLYVFLVYVLCVLSMAWGTGQASDKVTFALYSEESRIYLVVGSYEDSLVSVSIDEQLKTSGEIKLLPLSEQTNLNYQLLGTINPQKKTEMEVKLKGKKIQ